MHINWRLRLQNRTTLLALAGAIIALIYQALAMLGITPSVSENQVTEWIGMLVNVLVLLGIVVDPTTEGIGDTTQALQYEKPRKSTIHEGTEYTGGGNDE